MLTVSYSALLPVSIVPDKNQFISFLMKNRGSYNSEKPVYIIPDEKPVYIIPDENPV